MTHPCGFLSVHTFLLKCTSPANNGTIIARGTKSRHSARLPSRDVGGRRVGRAASAMWRHTYTRRRRASRGPEPVFVCMTPRDAWPPQTRASNRALKVVSSTALEQTFKSSTLARASTRIMDSYSLLKQQNPEMARIRTRTQHQHQHPHFAPAPAPASALCTLHRVFAVVPASSSSRPPSPCLCVRVSFSCLSSRQQ